MAGPSPNALDFRWRIGQIHIRVGPTFWFASAVLGIRYYADPEGGGLGFFLFWMAAVFVFVLLHELAHAAITRAFGAPAEVVLYALGSTTIGLEAIPQRGRRLLAHLVGVVVQGVILALVWSVTLIPFPESLQQSGWEAPLGTALVMLVWINYYWALLNLLPIWPLDGGQICVEIGEALLGRRGRVFALVFSLVVVGLIAIGVALQLSLHLQLRYDPRYVIYLQSDLVHLLFCFLFWLRGFEALWGSQSARSPVAR
jgi:membrane-associated protease RseP (regulator of RpoE activity)